MVIICTTCNAPLTGGEDTYGDPDMPVCYACWCRYAEEDVYGAAQNREWQSPLFDMALMPDCPDCEKRGELWDEDYAVWYECPRCEGNGWIDKTLAFAPKIGG